MTENFAPLDGLRILECSSFVAGPSGGMTLAQLGADVIRVDPLGGAADFYRWPLSQRSGASLFWTTLNRGKRSIAVDIRSAGGRELVVALATAPGPDAGIVVENNVGRPWLRYESLVPHRADVITLHIEGYADGRGAVDYTVNPEVGIPAMTGPTNIAVPVNHALPAWDLLMGMTATTGLLAAVRRREHHGVGANLQLALADIAMAGVANMGWLTEVDEVGAPRPTQGNYLYGSYGVDFATGDDARVMVVALTGRHWSSLCRATGTEKVFAALAEALDADFTDEGDRYRNRDAITGILRPWFASRPLADIARALDEAGALWSRYRTTKELIADFRAGTSDSVLVEVDQPGIGTVISARPPLRADARYGSPAVAPALGAHTDEVLTEVLGLTGAELGRLHDAGVVAGPR